jgi:uncharacterized membrane-anchored protein
MRRIVVIAAAVIGLAAVNYTIASRESIRKDGRIVLLELVPVDPRSLMQGDYMALRFKIAGDAFGRDSRARPADGYLVVRVNDDGVAEFRRFDDGSAVAADEVRLRYRWRDDNAKFATNAYFFEEGRAADYAGARYGELRVSSGGEVILTGLRNAAREPLGTRPRTAG